jgi:hypothetical protein
MRVRGPITWALLAGVIVAMVLSIAVVRQWGASADDQVLFGVIYGALFGLTGLGAAWTAFGPLSLVLRLPLALAIQAGLLLVVLFTMGVGFDLGIIGSLGGLVLGQWLLSQLPLWALVWRRRVSLRAVDAAAGSELPDHQFGIRQLLILTAIVAVMLGAGRLLVLSLQLQVTPMGRGQVAVLILVGFCNTILTLPLIVAALSPQRAILGCCLAIGLVALVTLCEIPAFTYLSPGSGQLVFWIMNFGQAFWVLLATGILRAGGYRLRPAGRI